MSDETKIGRTAQFLYVYIASSSGYPPTYSDWKLIQTARVDEIVINGGSTPSKCTFDIPNARWNQDVGIKKSDMIQVVDPDDGVVFQGFITGRHVSFSGGNQGGGSHESSVWIAKSYTWLLSHCLISGQYARGWDDYATFSPWAPKPGNNPPANTKDLPYTAFNGRRCIFNRDNDPNADPTPVAVYSDLDRNTYPITVFADLCDNTFWTARQMVIYLLRAYNTEIALFPTFNPADFIGIDGNDPNDADWNTVLTNICCEGLKLPHAIELICRNIGWSFREDWSSGGGSLIFFKVGAANLKARNLNFNSGVIASTIVHTLYAPDVGEDISQAVARGEKLVWAANFAEDITNVINNPVAIGYPDRFEFTAQLVPGWLDSDIVPDTSGGQSTLFVSEAALKDITNPDSYTFYNKYHVKGSAFNRSAARIWVLNEHGVFTGGTYDRGNPFDFSTVIPDAYAKNSDGKRIFGPFVRKLLNCITIDKDTQSSVGIKVEFSFDAGATWQVLPASIVSLTEMCGIRIDETNLSEMKDELGRTFQGGPLNGIETNYWTSVCNDKLLSHVFRNSSGSGSGSGSGNWSTRCRVTASVQLDQRLMQQLSSPQPSGSPFLQTKLLDFSDRYGLSVRTASSDYSGGSLSSSGEDNTAWLTSQINRVSAINRDASMPGEFMLDRLWLTDANGLFVFDIGDSVSQLAGRNYQLHADLGQGALYPEIVQIIHLAQKQKTKIITRDLRFSESRR